MDNMDNPYFVGERSHPGQPKTDSFKEVEVYYIVYQLVNVIDSGLLMGYSRNEFVLRKFIQQLNERYNIPKDPYGNSLAAFIIHEQGTVRVFDTEGRDTWKFEFLNIVKNGMMKGRVFSGEWEIMYAIDKRTNDIVTYSDNDFEDWGESGSYMQPHPSGVIFSLTESLTFISAICTNCCSSDMAIVDLVVQLGRTVLAYIKESYFAQFVIDPDETMDWEELGSLHPIIADSDQLKDAEAAYKIKNHNVWEPFDEVQIFIQEMNL